MRLLLILLLFCVSAYAENSSWGFTNTELPGYDNETNPNRTGIVSLIKHNNHMTFILDGETVGKHFNYCHKEYNNSWHPQAFEYISPSYVLWVGLYSEEDTLEIYLDDVLIDTIPNFCENNP